MTDLKIGKDTIKDLRNKDGTFKKGTEIGRMPKNGFSLSDLNKLVLEYEKSPENKKGTLLKHYIKRLYKNDRLLARYLDKNVPSKTINELVGAGGEPLSIRLVETVYKDKLGIEAVKEEYKELKSGKYSGR